VTWDGRWADGRDARPGIYFARWITQGKDGEGVVVRRIVLSR
jgi:hypothetical protein